MNELTDLQKIVLLLTFWFSPENLLKDLEWKALVKGSTTPLSEDMVVGIVGDVATGDDDYVDWDALESFKEDMQRSMH